MTNQRNTIDLADLANVTGGVAVNWGNVVKANVPVVGGGVPGVGTAVSAGVGAGVGAVAGAREAVRQVVPQVGVR